MRAIQVKQFGGPEVLELVDLPAPTPQGSLQLLAVTAAGVNYADTHQAADDYLAPQTLPFVPGAEVVGVDADGRRVVALVPSGGYAEQALAHPGTTFALPDEVDDTTALAFVLQGTTAWHLLRTSARMAPGETVVVHAGAGGVGCLAVQLARELGARRIIATASSPEKRDLARDLGADVALDPGAGHRRLDRPARRPGRGQRGPARRHRAGDGRRPACSTRRCARWPRSAGSSPTAWPPGCRRPRCSRAG